ncbi:hypothetical protein NEUTE2DRAFT_63991 [Neurospora tetrasperma FGSC 2509]|nr:hypothetical protein NEUTE2DRAFT_63991 [Neurospora tetrasperma FGSC 2509]
MDARANRNVGGPGAVPRSTAVPRSSHLNKPETDTSKTPVIASTMRPLTSTNTPPNIVPPYPTPVSILAPPRNTDSTVPSRPLAHTSILPVGINPMVYTANTTALPASTKLPPLQPPPSLIPAPQQQQPHERTPHHQQEQLLQQIRQQQLDHMRQLGQLWLPPPVQQGQLPSQPRHAHGVTQEQHQHTPSTKQKIRTAATATLYIHQNPPIPNPSPFSATAIPGITLSGTALPDVPFPSTAIPGVPFPNTAIPGTTIPGVPFPSTAIPSTTLPSVPFPGVAIPNLLPGIHLSPENYDRYRILVHNLHFQHIFRTDPALALAFHDEFNTRMELQRLLPDSRPPKQFVSGREVQRRPLSREEWVAERETMKRERERREEMRREEIKREEMRREMEREQEKEKRGVSTSRGQVQGQGDAGVGLGAGGSGRGGSATGGSAGVSVSVSASGIPLGSRDMRGEATAANIGARAPAAAAKMAEVGTSVGPPRVASEWINNGSSKRKAAAAATAGPGTETRPEKRSKTEMNTGQMRTVSVQKPTSTSTQKGARGVQKPEGSQKPEGLLKSLLKKGTGSSA